MNNPWVSSFPLYVLREPVFTARLTGWPHELIAAFAGFSDQSLALRSDDFLDGAVGWERTACSWAWEPESNPATKKIARNERGNRSAGGS
jgi:hypothetical protein